MTQKTIYLAGKVTGEPMANCIKKFDTKQKELEAKGYTVINPLIEVESVYSNDFPNVDWRKAMKVTLMALIARADEVHLLPDWSESRGAIIERNLARDLGIPIIY